MHEFNYNFLKEKQWDKEILGYIGLIHEYKGNNNYICNKNLLNLMREALGKTRKVEKCMETRTYIPRVLEQEVSK